MSEKLKGKCDVCEKEPRVLTHIDSGQRICRTCLQELRPTRPKHLASAQQLARLREQGINVGPDTTRADVKRFQRILQARQRGLDVSDDAPIEYVDQLLASLPRTLHTKVRGVTATNDDGSDRQKIVRCCKPGEMLSLVREPKNRYDRNAVAVYRKGGWLLGVQQIGYLSEDLAEEFAARLDSGERIEARVSEVTGGGGSFLSARKNYGLNIELLIYGP